MTTDTIKQLGAEFHRAADSLADTLSRLDNARLERLQFLRRCSADSTARLAAIKEELRTLPEQIAKWDAEAARLESQTAEDLLRQALEPAQEQPKPEPYRAGLPPERLRKVWAEWEDQEGHVVTFKDDLYHWTHWPPNTPIKRIMDVAWIGMKLRPLGNTHAYVEAIADEAEKPTLLDLTKLPPGTVCEAVGEILTYLGRRIKPGEVFRIVEPDDGMGDKHPTNIEIEFAGFSVPALVPARVVKEGGEQ